MEASLPANTESLTFEKVWAMFQETDRKFQETDQKMQETDRMMQETTRKMQETDRQISKLGSRIGQLIEHFAASNILEKFRELGYQFTRISRNHIIKDEQGVRLAEIDLLLENGDFAMIVEVKSLFTQADVSDHLKRMRTLRIYADKHADKRKYLGAAAGALMDEKAREDALESGLYVVEQTGDTVYIKEPPKLTIW
jgi:hypothetical protein